MKKNDKATLKRVKVIAYNAGLWPYEMVELDALLDFIEKIESGPMDQRERSIAAIDRLEVAGVHAISWMKSCRSERAKYEDRVTCEEILGAESGLKARIAEARAIIERWKEERRIRECPGS